MITSQQEANATAAMQRSKKHKQDLQNPMVININDGRLMPNNQVLRDHPNYRVYTGKLDASLPDRMRWIQGMMRSSPSKVVNSREEEDIFDLGAASKDDMIVFAMEQYGQVLDPQTDIRTLRKTIMQLAEKAAAGATETA